MSGRAVSGLWTRILEAHVKSNSPYSTRRDSCGCGRMPRSPSWDPGSSARSCKPYRGVYADELSAGQLLTLRNRDPSQHASLKAEIEAQSSAYYASARLWDDGIIKPTDTRDVVGLGLALAARERGTARSTTWDGSGVGFGIYRM